MKNQGLLAAAAVAALTLAGLPGVASPTVGFDRDFAASRWTTELLNSDGGVDVSGAPASITIHGPNNGSGDFGLTRFSIDTNRSLPFRFFFDWTYHSDEGDSDGFQGPEFDRFAVNGIVLSQPGPANQGGTFSLRARALAFEMHSADNDFGAAHVTISRFLADPGVPEPATFLLLGLGLAGLGLRRKAR